MVAHDPWQMKLGSGPAMIVNTTSHKDSLSDTLYAGCDGHVYAVDPATGQMTYSVDLDPWVHNGSASSDPREVCLAVINNGALVIAGYQGFVLGLDPVTLNVQWYTSLPKTGYDVVTVHVAGVVVFAASVGRVFKLDHGNGNIVATNNLPGRGKQRVEMDLYPNWHLAVGTKGYVILLEADTLETVQQISLPKCGYERVAVSVDPSAGCLFAASQGRIYRMGPGTVSVKEWYELPGAVDELTYLSVYGDIVAAGAYGKTFCYRFSGSSMTRVWTDAYNSKAPVRVLALSGIIYSTCSGVLRGFSTTDGTILRDEELVGRGTGEVTMLPHNQYMVMGISGWLTYCPPAIANFELQTQKESRWCWLALTSSIASYYQQNVEPLRWAQCNLANDLLGQSKCCVDGSTAQCNQRGRLHQALNLTGNLDKVYVDPFDMKHVAEALSYARPLAAQVTSNTVGHGVIVTGIHPNGTVDVRDPSYGQSSTISYDTLLKNYNGGLKWTATFSTK